jgi:hypothetical protein
MTSEAPEGRPIASRGAWLATEVEPRRGQPKRNVSSMSLLFMLGVAALLVGLAAAMQSTSYDIWGGLLWGSLLLLVTLPIATRAARREKDPRIGRILLLAALAKLSVGTLARYWEAEVLYKASDAEGYYNAGVHLIPQFQNGNFANLGSIVGTRFIEVISGLVLTIINQTRLGEFVVFSWMSFLGMFLFYKAFRLGFPEGDHRRYLLLLFFWPSMLFWPSSVGKDAWMVLMLGMSVLGVANLFVGRWRGFVWLGAGSLGCIMVRPHLSLIVIAGFALGLVLRRNRGQYTRMLARPFGTAVLLVGMIAVGGLVFQATQSFFKLDNLDLESAQAVLDSTSLKTSEGGSSFTPPSPNSPVGFVAATVTVMFRPFPTEAGGAAVATGLEGVLLAGLVVLSWRRIIRIPRMCLRNPFVAFATGYTAVFIFAFSSISNFGILARERSQLFPVLFILMAIPKREKGVTASEEASEDIALLASTS